ncbi:type II toxin-antitoxin system RelE/ParE family toxin [Ewingella americana]|uniref:type II toxin-antitoxin system RelE/ParE family toxin n=1 Tax=Ewingella americana TaxID=41202 RepID=UPI0012AD9529|nr:type II toxin-antitoxin system RelE/ParE family toxin [Ewingella americana]MRT02725.1 type II toxin-antitoxin system RelE/ParE family toxin [Ewingella americana]
MRVFRTKWFTKAAKSHGIQDVALCDALKRVLEGKAEDSGGGVYKKRLNKNRDRSIILAKGGQNWFYAFLFSKQDKANIDDAELAAFKVLAKQYAVLEDVKLTEMIRKNELVEICHEC